MEKGIKVEPSLVSSKTSNSETSVFPRENIGRWTASEHEIFLEGLQRYGNDWKQIANMISTRNLVQVRTHAQKFFQKINKNPCTKLVTGDYRRKKEPTKAVSSEPIVQAATLPSPISVALPEPSTSVPERIDISVPLQTSSCLFNPSNFSIYSPRPEYVLSDYDYISDSHRHSCYGSLFDIECNDYLDDLEFIDYAELKTPVFD